jgi:hypothetical protein
MGADERGWIETAETPRTPRQIEINPSLSVLGLSAVFTGLESALIRVHPRRRS